MAQLKTVLIFHYLVLFNVELLKGCNFVSAVSGCKAHAEKKHKSQVHIIITSHINLEVQQVLLLWKVGKRMTALDRHSCTTFEVTKFLWMPKQVKQQTNLCYSSHPFQNLN